MGLKTAPHEMSWAVAVKLQYRETRAQESARPRPHIPSARDTLRVQRRFVATAAAFAVIMNT
jgi:hypothetical protein